MAKEIEEAWLKKEIRREAKEREEVKEKKGMTNRKGVLDGSSRVLYLRMAGFPGPVSST